MGKDNDKKPERELINGLTAISNWLRPDEIFIEEFFLTKTGYPILYEKALARYEQAKQDALLEGKSPHEIKEPIEQLSPKGLALLMFLFSEKEKHDAQPLIASNVQSLLYIIDLMSKTDFNSQVVVIYQPTDNTDPILYNRHKTVFKLEKEDNVVRIINLDSVGPVFGIITLSILKDKILADKQGIKYQYYTQKMLLKSDHPDYAEFFRQQDDYQCGTISIKDARQLQRDTEFSETIQSRCVGEEPPLQLIEFDLPAEYYKVIQSRQFSNYLLPTLGEEVVTSKGKTLKETHQKHNVAEYVTHFSKKYREEVITFVQTHEAAAVKRATEKFDAANMTSERLRAIYGQPPKEDPLKKSEQMLRALDLSLKKPHSPLQVPTTRRPRRP